MALDAAGFFAAFLLSFFFFFFFACDLTPSLNREVPNRVLGVREIIGMRQAMADAAADELVRISLSSRRSPPAAALPSPCAMLLLRFRACIARDVKKSKTSVKTESLLFTPRREDDGYEVARERVVRTRGVPSALFREACRTRCRVKPTQLPKLDANSLANSRLFFRLDLGRRCRLSAL